MRGAPKRRGARERNRTSRALRFERSGFAYLPTRAWCRPGDSNSHCARFKRAASAVGLDRRTGGRPAIRTLNVSYGDPGLQPGAANRIRVTPVAERERVERSLPGYSELDGLADRLPCRWRPLRRTWHLGSDLNGDWRVWNPLSCH